MGNCLYYKSYQKISDEISDKISMSVMEITPLNLTNSHSHPKEFEKIPESEIYSIGYDSDIDSEEEVSEKLNIK